MLKKILIDATSIINKPTGVGRHGFHILENLLKEDKENEYYLLVQKSLDKKNPVFNLEANFISIDVPVLGPKRDLKLSFFFLKNRKKFDLFYCFMPYLPLFFYHPLSVITIHDLKFFKNPYFLESKVKSFYFRMIIKKSAKRASLIFTVSESTKMDVIESLSVGSEKIRVIYGDSMLDEGSAFKTDPRVQSKNPYFLCVAERRIHKNLEGLIRAFHLFLEGGDYGSLVLVGQDFQNNTDKLKNLSRELNLNKEVIFINNASDQDLINLYRGALAFVLPSFYEGFGLPLVEAMRFGVPIITSNISSMPEVVGRAGLLVDPYKINDIAEKMIDISQSADLRRKLINAGKERSKIFSWSKSAQTVRENLRRLLK